MCDTQLGLPGNTVCRFEEISSLFSLRVCAGEVRGGDGKYMALKCSACTTGGSI